MAHHAQRSSGRLSPPSHNSSSKAQRSPKPKPPNDEDESGVSIVEADLTRTHGQSPPHGLRVHLPDGIEVRITVAVTVASNKSSDIGYTRERNAEAMLPDQCPRVELGTCTSEPAPLLRSADCESL